MRLSLVATSVFFAPLLLALPIPRSSRMLSAGGSPDFEVLEYNRDEGYTKFEVAPGIRDDGLTSPLVLQVKVNPTPDLLTSNISLNDQRLDISWTPDNYTKSYVVASRPQTLFVSDRLGFTHSLNVFLTGSLTTTSTLSEKTQDATQDINLRIDSVDGFVTGLSFKITANPTAPRRLLGLSTIHIPQSINFDQYEESFMLDKQEHHVSPNEPVGYDEDAYDIETELESLLLLEAEASDLNRNIAAKKHAIAKCLKDHRDRVTLKHLLQQCDGVVCAAKVIAQRICDKMGIETIPKVGYIQVEDTNSQALINVDYIDEKISSEKTQPSTSEVYSSSSVKTSSTTKSGGVHSAAIQDVRLVQPQNVLLRVLGVIATALGLAALFGFIRRKCMSPRTRVDRAAAREERINARAYRRAARRAEMRRRWDAFVTAINCFKSPPERIEDYEEKRALILQEALLEMESGDAEKCEVMEAEIRELRHAQQIVSDMVRSHESRHELPAPRADPPPSMVPLPYSSMARSRASTQTLPSYCSEVLPDYTSRYATTETASSNSSLRSRSVATDGYTLASPTVASGEGAFTGSTPRSNSPGRSHSSQTSRTSRYTPTSSVIEVSPRASEDTLRTGTTASACRHSRDM